MVYIFLLVCSVITNSHSINISLNTEASCRVGTAYLSSDEAIKDKGNFGFYGEAGVGTCGIDTLFIRGYVRGITFTSSGIYNTVLSKGKDIYNTKHLFILVGQEYGVSKILKNSLIITPFVTCSFAKYNVRTTYISDEDLSIDNDIMYVGIGCDFNFIINKHIEISARGSMFCNANDNHEIWFFNKDYKSTSNGLIARKSKVSFGLRILAIFKSYNFGKLRSSVSFSVDSFGGRSEDNTKNIAFVKHEKRSVAFSSYSLTIGCCYDFI